MSSVDQPHENFVFPEEVLPRGNHSEIKIVVISKYLEKNFGVFFCLLDFFIDKI